MSRVDVLCDELLKYSPRKTGVAEAGNNSVMPFAGLNDREFCFQYDPYKAVENQSYTVQVTKASVDRVSNGDAMSINVESTDDRFVDLAGTAAVAGYDVRCKTCLFIDGIMYVINFAFMYNLRYGSRDGLAYRRVTLIAKMSDVTIINRNL